MCTSSDAHELNHECARQNEYPYFISAIKHIHVSYFDSNTIVLLQCAALVFFGKAYVDRMSSG